MTVIQETPACRFAHRISLLGTENAFKVGPYIAKIEQAGHRVIRCNIGEPDFALPEHITAEVKKQLDAGQTHYVDPQGIEPLRRTIAKTMGERRGLNITPDRVVVFPGAKPPIGFAQQVYCDPGAEVIYPTPGFPIYESFTRFTDLVPRPLQLREERGFNVSAPELERMIDRKTALIYLNFPSNPTGGAATREQLAELAEVIQYKALPSTRVYSDEVYEDILYNEREHHSIASMPGMEERTIIVSGVSKSFAWTGGRVGWAVFPSADEAAVFRNLNINYFSCVPAYNQWGAKVALESPESAVSIRNMNTEFARRREMVVGALNAIPGITCRKPEGAFYVFPNISGACASVGAVDAWLESENRRETSPATLFQLFLLFRYHVATLDRRSFGVLESEGQQYLRISIATSFEDLEEAMRRIRAASQDRAGFRDFIAEGRFA